MPRKSKRKGFNKIQRQFSTPEKSTTKKKKLPHSSNSATELTRFNEEGEFNNTPPTGNSRPTSPINFILPLLENGFSWPRRKSPFKSSQNDKNVRSPLLSSPDSGYPSSPTQDDCYLETKEEKDEKQVIKLVPREPCISPLSDEENKRISNDIEDIIASLDDAINEDTSEDDLLENGKIDVSEDDAKIDASSDDGKIDLSSDECRIDASSDDGKIDASSDDCELYNGDDKVNEIENKKDYMDDITNTKVKDNKGTISKKVRFKLNHPPLRKCKSVEEYPYYLNNDPHEWEVIVQKVDIRRLPGNEEGSECVVLETFNIMVCHHPECTENNGDKPLLMCKECDKSIHGNPDYSGHLVLDAPKKKITGQSSLARGTSTPNLPVNNSDNEIPDGDDEGVDTEDCVDGIYMKKAEAPDFKPPATPTAHELKLKRKKAYKLKRRHTDEGQSGTNVTYYDASDDADSDQGDDAAPKRAQQNCNVHADNRRHSEDTQRELRRQSKSVINDEYFTVRFTDNGKDDMEICAAIKNVSLRTALQSILERRGMDVNFVNVYVEASNTPLPLDCESFLLGGNTLNVRKKDIDGSNSLSRSTSTARPNGSTKSLSNSKGPKNSGMSRRESFFGRTPVLLETPPVKQRRNSLSFPFFAAHPTPKVAGDQGPRMLDDIQPTSSLRSRRGINLSIDDTYPIPTALSSSVSPVGTLTFTEGKKIKDRSKLTNLFSPLSKFSSELRVSSSSSLQDFSFEVSTKDREKQEQLSEILNNYSSNGLPPCPECWPSYDDTIFEIEPHWSSIVDNASTLTKRQHDQQEAIWELLQTEVYYIKSLRVITDLFMCCLTSLQKDVLCEIDIEKLFSNIEEIARVNCSMWECYLQKVLLVARETRCPFNPSDMREGFKQFQDLFQPYTKYCLEQKACAEYMKAKYTDDDLFKTFVVWAETQKQCNRLKLTDLLVKPMQRLTKYSLLLQAILRKTDDDKQRRDLLEMIGGVDKFVFHVNATLRQKHEQERLATLMTKIESYDAVEAPNDESLKFLNEYNTNFDLRAPMPGCGPGQTRSLIMQSVLKLKDAQTRMDVACLLFTDLLLVCKPSKRMEKYKIIKPPMRVDRIIVHELKDKGSFLLIYLNEYHVPVTAFTFHHSDQNAIRLWLDQIKKAQELYSEVRNSVQISDGLSYLTVGEVVEEEVIRITPLKSPGDSDMILSQNSSEELHGLYVPSTADGQSSPGGRDSPMASPSNIIKSISYNEIESRQLHQRNSFNSQTSDVSPTDTKHKQVQSSFSVPTFHDRLGEDLRIPSSNGSSANSDSSLPDIGDENYKSKNNKRRVSKTEKRWYTDGAIELNKAKDNKDSGIHKRLSWNLGTNDPNEHKQGELKHKTQSTDSIRSFHSSSGVSSTGSLHLGPDDEIIEEYDLDLSRENSDISTIHESRLIENEGDLHICDKPKSKSTTDIATLFNELSTSEEINGISSVDLPKVDKKTLSHAQVMRMKKQLLLTSNSIEASEV